MATEGLPGIADSAAGNPQAGRKEYVVVARRYRPQTFAELVGQEHVARALSSAITSNRVGHAYLFTGARGVGKTSAARILAKCLNCVQGPSPTPCDRCDSCLSIAAGDDVDVLEIDGASNRGIEEMRELRHNVAIRPSRSRFKIYIIDEVHMLTREAFNALLKTLEEPPEHVKFIFCTTEAEKIPVTILSRCQRFDFAGIQAGSIVDRLQQIVTAEGVEADRQALVLLSRRAGGSMRDSQSLLEQLLAVGGQKITLEDVNQLLGTASDERLSRLVGHLVERDAAAAMADLDDAVTAGVDTGQLLDQLLVYFRDLMVSAVGGSAEILLQNDPAAQASIAEQAQRFGLQTVLAAMQILDHTLARLRYSTQGRVLSELALVRICQLADLEDLAALIEQIKSGGEITIPTSNRAATPPSQRLTGETLQTTPTTKSTSSSQTVPAPPRSPINEVSGSASKKNDEGEISNQSSSAPAAPAPALTDAPRLWQQALAQLTGMVADYAMQADSVAISAPNSLVVTFAKKYNLAKAFCEKPDQVEKIERAVAGVVGRNLKISFVLDEKADPAPTATPARTTPARDSVREKAKHPLVSRAIELFDARPMRVDDRRP